MGAKSLAFTLLYLFFWAPILISGLFGAGPSSYVESNSFTVRNYVEIFSVFLMSLFSITIFSSQILNDFLKNKQLFPFFMISFIYLLSCFWSTNPLFSLFRLIEFIVID